MIAKDSILIDRLVQEINIYLNDKQRADSLWDQVDMHLQASYLAESLGDTDLVPRHLQAVTRLLVEASEVQQRANQHIVPVQLH